MRDDCQPDGMKVLAAVIACVMLLIPCACAQSLDEGLIHTVEELDIASIEQASGQENIGMILLRLAKGDKVWDAQEMLDKALDTLLGEVRRSMGRMTLLMAPSIACGVAGLLAQRNKSVAEMVQSVCFLTLATLIMADAQVYLRESEDAVVRMASLMEALFPVLMTLLSAVGATSGAALFKPAIAAASGTMTALVRNVSLRHACLRVPAYAGHARCGHDGQGHRRRCSHGCLRGARERGAFRACRRELYCPCGYAPVPRHLRPILPTGGLCAKCRI